MAPSVLNEATRDGNISFQKDDQNAAPEAMVPDPSNPALLHRSLLEKPYNVASGNGSYLTLKDGRQILDGCGGAAVAIIGHGNQEVKAAMIEQIDKISYIHTISYTTDAAEELAECILDNQPENFDHGLEKVYFCGSGSEANDAAMKLCRQVWYERGQPERKYFVSRRQAYHGNTIGSMSVSTILARKIPYDDIQLPYTENVSPAYAYQYQLPDESEAEYVKRLLNEIEETFQRLGPQNIISFLAEPVVGAASGCVCAPAGYFKGVRALCDKYGILLHLDEIMCGVGRTGTYFAFEQENIVPDVMTIGKGLGGGYSPIAAVLVSKGIVDALRKGTSVFNHGQTYQAHPMVCAAALAVQRIVKRENLVHRCMVMGLLLERSLFATLQDRKHIGNIRGRGLFWALEFVKDKSTKESLPASLNFGSLVQKRAFELGVAVYPGAGTVDGYKGDHVIIAPPYTVSDEDLRKIVNVLREAYDIEEGRLDLGI